MKSLLIVLNIMLLTLFCSALYAQEMDTEADTAQEAQEEYDDETQRTDDRAADQEDDVFERLAAKESKSTFGTPRNWTAHLSFGVYRLTELDSEFSGGGPSDSIFGDDFKMMFQLGAERLLYQGYGMVGIEAATGFWQTYGKGIFRTGGKSTDTTVFNMIPLKLSAVYRYSDPWDKYGIPLVPFVKLGLDYYIWWILGQDGDVSSYESDDGNTSKGYGGTFGFHVSYGLQICLDFIDSELATDFDQDVGVNNTHIYIEGTYAKVNDFWSGSSFDLSDHHFMVGLLFEI